MKTNEGGAAYGAIGKERRKLLATSVVFAMVLAGLVIAVSDVEMSSAEPEGTPVTDYTGLSTAFTTDGTYYLANDITVESASQLSVTADVVLDLNGNTMSKTYEQLNNFLITIKGGSLTINDSGTDGGIKSVDYGIRLYSDSSLTVNGGAIETVDESIDIYTSATNVSVEIAGGSITSTADNVLGIRGNANINVEITGGTMVSNGRTGVYVSSYEENAITITMTGGSIEHTDGLSGAFQIYSGANVTIGGDAKVSSENRTLVLQTGQSQSTLNITGGTISSTSRGSAVIDTEGTAELNISGGTFEATSNKVLSATEDTKVTIDGVGIELSGEMTDNATLTINEGASASIADGFEMESNNKITNNGTLDVEGEITGATDANLTGTGIVLGYEGEGFTDSTKVDGQSINVTAQNMEQVMASINDNPDMYEGITEVSITENVTIDDVISVPAGIALSSGESTITTSAEGNGIVLKDGASFSGTISMGAATVTAQNLVSAGELSILHGSIVFDGDAESGSAMLISMDGEDVILTGTLNSGVSVTIVQGSETVNVPVRFDNFNDNGGTVAFQSYGAVESSETIPDWVDAVFAGNIMLGGLTITNSAEYIYNGTSQYPSNMLASVSGMTSQGFINKTLDGLAISNSDLGIYKIDGESLVQAEAVDAGTYYVYYGYFVDGVLHSYLCEWVIQTADATIDFDSIDKTYDGTIALESSDAVTVADVPNVVFGTPVYEDMNVGDDKAVILTVEFQNGAIPSNYTFSINEQVVEILGDAESGYYIELQGSISKKAIDVTVTAPEKEYDGNAYGYTYTVGTGVEGDQLTVTVTTGGVDAGSYIGTSNLSFGDLTITNGDVDVTDNYAVTINDSSALTIDQRDITVSPAAGAQITKVYNGYSSRVMAADDFQMTGVIGDDDVSFTWTNNATYVKYNSPNVDEADTLTVTGLSLTGTDAANYELASAEVVFSNDDENGVTVGITPFVLGFTGGSTISIDKTFDGTVAAPVDDITSDDYTVSVSQAGAQPTVAVTTAVYDSADAGTGKIVYITGIVLSNNDYGNFALPETQTSGDISYYFSLSGESVKIEALEIIGDMISWDITEDENGKIVLTLSVSSGELKPTGFTSSLTASGGTTVSAIEGTNSYVIDVAGSYTAKVSSSDSNWSGINVEKNIPVEFTYTANFYTKDIIDGDYILEQTIIGNKQIQTPNATNIPEGYVLCGWALEPNGPMVHGLNVFVNVSAVDTSFYAVYKEDSGSGTTPEQPFVGLMDIVEGAIHYPYDGGFVYTGDFSIVNGNVVVTYDSEFGEFLEDLIESGKVPEKVPDELVPMMNDLARFLGALHYSAPSVVESITYDGTVYTWEDHVSNKGNNWYNGNKSLVSVIVADALRSDGVIELILTDGIARYAFTYGVQFEEAPVEPTKELPGIAIDMPVFTESEEGIFQVSFVANDYLNETITVKATFSGTAESVYYWNVNNDDWSAMVAEEGGSYLYGGSGFQLSDATSTFKATISDAGVYTLTVEIIHNDATLASATETFVVVEADVPEYYSVTFDVDGNTSTIKVTAGDYILLSTPSKEGYTFDGWYVQGDDSILYTLYYTPSGDTTLVAKFTEDQTVAEPTYSVAFGTASTLEGLKVGDVVTMPAVTPEENYRLIGWETESGIVLTGQQYYVYAADDANGDKTITLVPVFEKYVFTVTISGGDNGVIGTTEITVNKGETAVITGIEANPGYYVESVTATGGYNVVDFNGSYVIFDVTSDVTVTVTFAADPGAMDITMTAALTEGGVIVTMSSNDGGNLSAGKIEVVYSYTEYDEELGMSIPATGLVEIDYDSVGQTSTSKLVAVTFPATANYAYAQFVVGGEVRAQSAYFAALLES